MTTKANESSAAPLTTLNRAVDGEPRSHGPAELDQRTSESRRFLLGPRALEARRRVDLPYYGLPEELERLALDALDQYVNALSRILVEAVTLTRDHLTQLPNRAAGERFFIGSQAEGRRLVVGLGDFDHFKNINDTFGHITGDDVLSAGAKVFDTHCSPFGTSFRFGGEELGFCLRDIEGHTAMNVLENVRADIEKLVIVPRASSAQPVSITVSIGLTAVQPRESFEDAFARADRALYEAKRAGRNRTCVAANLMLATQDADLS